MATGAVLRMRVLGGFALGHVPGDGRPADVPIATQHGRALLAYLALQPELRESRERLATLLWGDRGDRQARQSLRQCLLVLRKALEPADPEALQVGADAVALDGARWTIDAREFPALARSDEPAALERAIALYQGDLLDGLRLAGESIEEWLGHERLRLRAQLVLALERAAAIHDARGAGAAAIAAAERLAALDPLDEGAQRRLLTLLLRHGGRDAALVRAAGLADTLQRELGTAPEPATRALIAAIRAEQAPQPAPSPEPPAAHDHAPAAPRPGAMAAPEAGAAALPRSRTRRIALPAAAAAALVSAALFVAADRLRPAGPAQPTAAPAPAAPAGPPSWAPPGRLAASQRLAAAGVSALLVLPFAAIAEGEGGEASAADRRLAEVVSDDLSGDLSRIPNLRVIARQTARVYAGRPVDVAVVGTELGVRYVIEGSVQRQGQRLRISAALVDAGTRLTMWSERFERDYDGRFAVRDEIVRAVVRALQLGIFDAEDQRRPPDPPAPAGERAADARREAPEIADLLARGWSAMVRLPNLGTGADAGRYFGAVLGRDPDNVPAMVGLGGWHAGLAVMFLVPDGEEHLAQAEPLLRRAQALAPSSVMSGYYLGLVQKARGQYGEALRSFTRVVEQNPSFPLGYAQLGHLVSRLGRPDEAMEYIRYAMRLNPRDPNVGIIGLMAGEIELELGHDAAALDWLRRSLTYTPVSPFAHAVMAAVLALTGDAAGAEAEVRETNRLAPWLTVDRIVDRLVATSAPGHEPRRLIYGLRRAFGPAF